MGPHPLQSQSERTPYSPHRAEGGGRGREMRGGDGRGGDGRGGDGRRGSGEAVEREVLLAHHLLVHNNIIYYMYIHVCAHTVIHVYILSLLKLRFCSELLERFSSERENGASNDTVYVASTDCSTDLDVLGVHTGGALVGSSERSWFSLGTRAG